MNKQQKIFIFAACAAGFAAGWMTEKFWPEQDRLLSSEKVLSLVKKKAKEKLPIDGAWIFMSPHAETNGALTHQVYQGGLTVTVEKSVTHYDFVADACSGVLLKLTAQSAEAR
ncbi:MAG: hypothetical protein ACE3JK_11330 [Sporolactobacillus sp.]